MNHCLLTGASGFIGRVLCQTLLKKNIHVRALLRTDPTSVWNEEHVDTVFYLAGIAHVSGQPRLLYDKVNRADPLDLCRVAAEHGVKRFIYFSSVKAVNNPSDFYGYSKYQAEQGLLALVPKVDMHISIVRPALVYGPNLKGNLYSMIKAIDKGWFPPIPETHNHRSMVSVEDVVMAAIACASNPVAHGKIYTVSDDTAYSTRQVYNAMREALDLSPRQWCIPKWLLTLPAYVSKGYAGLLDKLLGSEVYSAELIKRELGWAPTSNFYKDIKDIVLAYRQQR